MSRRGCLACIATMQVEVTLRWPDQLLVNHFHWAHYDYARCVRALSQWERMHIKRLEESECLYFLSFALNVHKLTKQPYSWSLPGDRMCIFRPERRGEKKPVRLGSDCTLQQLREVFHISAVKGGGHGDGEMETCSVMQATTNLTAQCEPALFHRSLVREKKNVSSGQLTKWQMSRHLKEPI